MGAVAYKGDIVSLSNAGDMDRTELHSQVGQLCEGQFRIVGEFVEPIAQNSTLFDPKEIVNRPHQAFIPLNKCFAVFQPIVKVCEALAITTSKVCSPDTNFPKDFAKGALGIKEEEKEGLFQNEEGVLYHFSDQQSSKLMAATRPLKLGFSLSLSPACLKEVANILV